MQNILALNSETQDRKKVIKIAKQNGKKFLLTNDGRMSFCLANDLSTLKMLCSKSNKGQGGPRRANTDLKDLKNCP